MNIAHTKGMSIVHMTCSNGHQQAFFLDGNIEWARHIALLLDGSSALYIHDPRVARDSNIGRCGVCRAQLTSRVESAAVHSGGSMPVDRSNRTLVDGEPVPLDDSHRDLDAAGMQKAYVVLTAEERAKGFVRPVRDSYRHLVCQQITSMGKAIAETYARDPAFYNGTYCWYCRAHFPVGVGGEFVWVDDGTKVGT
jgi:hypothetical protein